MSKESMAKCAIVGILLVALIIGLIFALMKPTESAEGSGMGLTVDPYSGTFVAPEKEDKEDGSGGIAIPGWGSISIPAGEATVDVNLQNPIDNKDKYNLSFALYLKDDEEPLAVTGLIRPGESALKLLLSEPLEAGNYEATILVQPYRIADNSMTNNAEIETILIVE